MVNEISSRLAGEALDETLQIQFSPVAEGTSKTLTVRVVWFSELDARFAGLQS